MSSFGHRINPACLITKRTGRRISIGRARIKACVLAFLLGSGATGFAPDAVAFSWLNALTGESGATTLWSSSDGQYVRLVADDDTSPGNQHPTKLSEAELRAALSALEVFGSATTGVFDDDVTGPRRIFTPSEMAALTGPLLSGLQSAAPNQDVVFAVIGMHPGSISKERMVVSGRLFFRDERLNVIFGELHRPLAAQTSKDVRGLNIDVDRRLQPFATGDRKRAIAHSWRPVTSAGVSFAITAGRTRDDWLVLDLAAKETHHPTVAPSTDGAVSGQGPGAGQPASAAPAAASRSPKARLHELEELRRDKLIDESEYQSKRRQILNDL